MPATSPNDAIAASRFSLIPMSTSKTVTNLLGRTEFSISGGIFVRIPRKSRARWVREFSESILTLFLDRETKMADDHWPFYTHVFLRAWTSWDFLIAKVKHSEQQPPSRFPRWFFNGNKINESTSQRFAALYWWIDFITDRLHITLHLFQSR